MKSLKLIAVAALLGIFFMACEAESLNEDQQLIEEVEAFSKTENGVKVLNDNNEDSDNPRDKYLTDYTDPVQGSGTESDDQQGPEGN